jgi:hypothetical protein
MGEPAMKISKSINTLVVAVVATLVGASAWGNNGVQFFNWDDEVAAPGVYIECLGEHVTWIWHITTSYRDFETPSGTYHLLDNWTYTGMYTGLVTGRTWVNKGVSPFQWNAGPGETNQWVSKSVAKPLTGDGPMFVFKTKFKITVTANGDLVVERPGISFEELGNAFRCLGKK